LKIAYDYKIFWSQKYGGISRYFVSLFTNLSLKKLDYKVIAPFYKNEYLNKIDPKNIDGKYMERLLPYTSLLFEKYNEIISPIKIKKWDPTLIHYTYYYQKLDKINKPIIITVYDLIHEKISIENGNPIFPKKRMIEVADHIIAISKKTKEDLIKIYNIEEKKISVIYLGGDHSQINNIEISSDLKVFSKPYILFVGSRAKYKNFSFFLNSYAKSKKLLNQFDLMLFGGGKLTSQELKLMNLLGIETNSVKQINGNDSLLIDLYRKAEVFVFPSLYEGFGIPIIESFINKCPVICSDIEIFKEIAENSVKYFNPKESLSLTDAMENVIFSPSEKNSLKERGYLQSKKYSWDKCASETISIYKKFL